MKSSQAIDGALTICPGDRNLLVSVYLCRASNYNNLILATATTSLHSIKPQCVSTWNGKCGVCAAHGRQSWVHPELVEHMDSSSTTQRVSISQIADAHLAQISYFITISSHVYLVHELDIV